MLRRPRPTIALMVSASRMNGNDSCTSAIRMSDRRGPALDEAGQQSEQPTGHRRHQHRAHADEQGQARAVEHARQQIAAELIGPERMAGRAGRLEARREVGASADRQRASQGAATATTTAATVRTRPSHFFTRLLAGVHERCTRTRGSSQP